MLDDFRFAIRRLRHSPGFTVVALLTLTLAIGVNVAILSVADAVLFRPLPYEDPDSVFVLQMVNPQTGQRYTRIAGEHLRAVNEHHRSVSDVALAGAGPRLVIDGPAGAENVPAVAVTQNYFTLLGVRAQRGRVFIAPDASASTRPAMLTDRGWRTRFNGDETVVGRSIPIGSTTFDVVGVLPADFVFPSAHVGRPEIVTLMPPSALDGGAFNPIVRLEGGVTREHAQSEMDALIIPLTRATAGRTDTSIALDSVRSVIYPAARSITLFLVAAAVLVLLIGCANLANMMLARTARQERETGVRATLGAGRLRLVRPVLFECLVLGAAGSLLALLAGWMTFDGLLSLVPRVAYGNAPVGLDLRVAVIALGMGLTAGFCFAIVPAWRTARVDPQVLLQSRRHNAGSTRGWLRHPLIAVQVAASIALVFGAVVAGRAFFSLLNVPLGFDPTDVVRIRVSPADKGDRLRDFYATVIETLAARGDVVVAAGAAGTVPFDGFAPDEGMLLPDGRRAPAALIHTFPGYFEALKIRVLRGRSLEWNDLRQDTGAAAMSQSAAAAVFPGQEALGRTIVSSGGRRYTVVGIVGDILKSHNQGTEYRDPPPVYVIPGTKLGLPSIMVRVPPGLNREAVLADLKRTMAPLAPRTPVAAAWWTDSIRALSDYSNPRFQTIVLGGFGLLAVVLTGIGVFAVISFLVASRTREIGIRIAIGAEPRALVGHMVRHALVPAAVGLAGGLLATRWLAGFAEAQLFKVDTRDPLTLLVAAATVMTSAILAAYIPARHAAQVDPIVALRAE